MTPLLLSTISFALGLLAGFRSSLSAWAAVVACTCAALLFLPRRRLAAMAGFVTIGIVTGALRARSTADDCRERLNDGAVVRLTGYPLVVPTEGVTIAFHAHTLASGDTRCADVALRIRAAARH